MFAYAPQKSLPSVPVPADDALALLQTYLTSATHHAYLLPNATLTTTGPTAQAASSNLTIHNLKRVVAGLQGEWLAPTLELTSSGAHVVGAQDTIDEQIEQREDANKEKEMQEQGWQELEEYQQEQSDIEGEIGERMPHSRDVRQTEEAVAVDASARPKIVEGVDVGEDGDVQEAPVRKITKEERKAAKKERMKAEKKAKHQRG